MKISEFLRHVADKLEKVENKGKDSGVDQQDENMVPPLQQELELKKKQQGVDNVFDNPAYVPESNNELSIIKRNAGIQ